MNNIIIHVAGTNGSGKSTPLKQLWESDQNHRYILDEQGRGYNSTYLQDMGVVVLGRYHNACGGCDGLTGNGGLARVSEAIEQIFKSELYGIPIFFEGLLTASYVNIERVRLLAKAYNYRYLLVHADPELETCIARVQARNGGKPVNNDNIEGRWKNQRNTTIPKLLSEGNIPIVIWNNDDVSYDEMLSDLIGIVDKWIESF